VRSWSGRPVGRAIGKVARLAVEHLETVIPAA
jgi:hypothetical protein